jgi:hypothetical protein
MQCVTECKMYSLGLTGSGVLQVGGTGSPGLAGVAVVLVVAEAVEVSLTAGGSFLLGLQTTSVTMPSVFFNNCAACQHARLVYRNLVYITMDAPKGDIP